MATLSYTLRRGRWLYVCLYVCMYARMYECNGMEWNGMYVFDFSARILTRQLNSLLGSLVLNFLRTAPKSGREQSLSKWFHLRRRSGGLQGRGLGSNTVAVFGLILVSSLIITHPDNYAVSSACSCLSLTLW